MQQFAERNNIAGYRLQDYVKANYGANLSNGIAQRSLYLGSGSIPVYSKGVYQTAPFSSGSAVTQNPFEGSPAAQYGSALCSGKLDLVKDFVAEEPGCLMVLASLVPKVTYSTGVDKMMTRYNDQNTQSDMANPILQNVGNEPIFVKELNGNLASTTVFGYSDRYASFKDKRDMVSGLFRDGQSLQSFVLQRSFSTTVNLSSGFLEIPTSYMDQISAVNAQISNYGVQLDVFHDYKASMPLSSYSIPSLQDPAYEHGETVEVQINGSRL